MGVEGRLVQVLQNLIENALSFTTRTKPVMLAAAAMAVLWRDVEDVGPGIPENKLSAIFDRFLF